MKFIANPKCPPLQDLPILCIFVSLLFGKSKLISTFTVGTSLYVLFHFSYSSCAQIRAHETLTLPCSEIMEYHISMFLLHLSVNIKARISDIRNFFGQKLHPFCRITKYYSLIYL